MITQTAEISHSAEMLPRTRARVAGLLYLSVGLFAPFSLLYVPSTLIVPGDVAATARHIMASETLFRLGVVSALVSQILNVVAVLALYQVLKPANKNMARLMVIFLLLGVPIAMLNDLNNLAVLFLLSGADSL